NKRKMQARIKEIFIRANKADEKVYDTIKIGDLIIYIDKYEAMLDTQKLSFTRMEFELLVYLAKHKGMVLSRDQLLDHVWNYEFSGETRIVDVHISRLREKIKPDTKKPM